MTARRGGPSGALRVGLPPGGVVSACNDVASGSMIGRTASAGAVSSLLHGRTMVQMVAKVGAMTGVGLASRRGRVAFAGSPLGGRFAPGRQLGVGG